MRYSYSFSGSSGLKMTYKVGATVVAGQPVVWITGSDGTAEDPASVTDLTNALGVTTHAATLDTTQGNTEGIVEVMVDPLAVFNAKTVPSATADTNYADGDGYYLTADSANTAGTTVADSATGGTNDDMNDGMVFSISGANVGQSRVMTDHVASTSVITTVPFLNDIAAGDSFVASQYAPGVIAVQMTTDFSQLNGTVAGATGGEAVVVNVYVDTSGEGYSKTTPRLSTEFVMQDHAFNSVA